MEKVGRRQVCPVCGVIIYLSANGYYRCHLHGDWKLNYNSGKLVKVGKKNPPC
jgi:hypothetical protein